MAELAEKAAATSGKCGGSPRACWATLHLILELAHVSTCVGVYNLFADYWDSGLIGDLLAQVRSACSDGADGDS
eukprot:COSAG06_NODE_67600_length_251_cov_1.013158_1_plen_73_part_10